MRYIHVSAIYKTETEDSLFPGQLHIPLLKVDSSDKPPGWTGNVVQW